MDDTANLANAIQAFLFAEGGTISYKKLSQLLDVDQEQVVAAIDELARKLNGSGLCIIRSETEATLAVAQNESAVLKAQYEKELGRERGEAGLLEVAILLCRGPAT